MISKFVFSATVALMATNLYAQEDIEETTLTTATRTNENQFDVAAAANVITEQDIARMQFTDIADVLELVGSTDVVRSGGVYGGLTSMFTRGTESDHTLVLINGLRFSSASSGSTAFELIDPALIKRVEFVRGSRSSLYGSEAIGGVMQVSTYDESEENEVIASSQVASNTTYKQVVGGNYHSGGLNVSGGVSFTHSDGIDTHENDSFGNEDLDAYENQSANVFGGYEFKGGAKLNASFIQSDATIDYDNSYAYADTRPYKKQTLSAFQTHLFLPVTSAYSTELNLGKSLDHSDQLDYVNDTLPSYFNTDRDSLFWQNTLNLNEFGALIFGVDAYEERLDAITGYFYDEGTDSYTPVTFDKGERSNVAAYVQLQGAAGLAHFVLGARNDDDSQFGSHTTGTASLNFHIEDSVRVFGSVAQGFKSPTFNDLYYPGFSNDQLLPEESLSSELGVKFRQESYNLEFIAYHTDVENLIAWDSVLSLPNNVNEAEIKGLETTLVKSFGALKTKLSAGYSSPKDKQSGDDLVGRAKRKASLTLEYDLNEWDFGAVIRTYGERKASVWTDEMLEPYELLDFVVNFQPSDFLSFGAKVINVTDESYTQKEGYNTDGRNYKANVTFTF